MRVVMPGGGRLRLETGIRDDGRATLAIEDTGPGIPPDLRCRIFEPFFTSKEAGTGLGLPLALHIVRDHEGDIEVDNVPDGGARFTIVLPRASAAEGTCAGYRREEGRVATP